MTATIAKKPRQRGDRSGRGLDRLAGLPKSAAFTACGGQDFVLLPVKDLAEWLEDQIDYAESMAALDEERHLAIPIEQAIAQLSGHGARKAK
jgi:hypothetical protein